MTKYRLNSDGMFIGDREYGRGEIVEIEDEARAKRLHAKGVFLSLEGAGKHKAAVKEEAPAESEAETPKPEVKEEAPAESEAPVRRRPGRPRRSS